VLLLLFTIGLHLRFRSVLRTEVLGVGPVQMALSATLFTAVGVAFGLDLHRKGLLGGSVFRFTRVPAQ
jgi:hypothetical protein